MTHNTLVCLHCEEDMPPFVKPRLYCSLACEQEAELVRYVRRCSADGRIKQEDVQLAITIRLAHIMAGGYNKNTRKISKETKKTVIQRSQGKCEICAQEGYDIDHIDGASGDLSNLQLLCKDCHNQKTQLSIVPIEPGTPQHEYVKLRTEEFWHYVEAKRPERVCHDQENWNSLWRKYLKERKSYASVIE